MSQDNDGVWKLANGVADTAQSKESIETEVSREIIQTVGYGHKYDILGMLLRAGTIAEVSDIRDRAFALGRPIPFDTIVRTLWSMQKEAHVSFRQRAGDLVKIKLTDAGRAKAVELHGRGSRPVKSGESPGRHPVGVDLTDYRHHGAQAVGGPIERIGGEPRYKPKAAGPIDYKVPTKDRYAAPEPPRQNERPVLSSMTTSQASPEVQGMPAEVQGNDMGSTSDTHTQYATPFAKEIANMDPAKVWPVIEILRELGPSSQIDIQKRLGVSSARISGYTTKAVQLGWLTKKRGPDNKTILTLTERGRTDGKPTATGRGRWPAVYDPPTSKIDLPNGMTPADADVQGVADVVRAIESYPLIADLMGRGERIRRYEQAAELLMDDESEIALSLLEKIRLSPLEMEVIRYIRDRE